MLANLLADPESYERGDFISVVLIIFNIVVSAVYVWAPAKLTIYLGKKINRGEFKTPEVQDSFDIVI